MIFLIVSIKPFNAMLLPNLILFRKFTKCYCLEQSVPSSLEDIVLDLVPLTILSKGKRAALDSDGICSMISFVGIPEKDYEKNIQNEMNYEYVRFCLLKYLTLQQCVLPLCRQGY